MWIISYLDYSYKHPDLITTYGKTNILNDYDHPHHTRVLNTASTTSLQSCTARVTGNGYPVMYLFFFRDEWNREEGDKSSTNPS